VTNTGSSGQDGVGRFTVSNFGTGAVGTSGPWTLDAGYDSTTTGVIPNNQDRPGADSGSVVGWNFDPNFIPVGGSSRTLVIKTNADFFTAGNVAAIDGATVDLAGYQPTVAPEPSSMAIAGLGALGLIGYGIRRRRRGA
jgi:MYXO-CTERM domain-containing protein